MLYQSELSCDCAGVPAASRGTPQGCGKECRCRGTQGAGSGAQTEGGLHWSTCVLDGIEQTHSQPLFVCVCVQAEQGRAREKAAEERGRTLEEQRSVVPLTVHRTTVRTMQLPSTVCVCVCVCVCVSAGVGRESASRRTSRQRRRHWLVSPSRCPSVWPCDCCSCFSLPTATAAEARGERCGG